MKQIDINKLFNYINPLELEEKPAIAVASSGKETNGLTIGWASFGTLWSKKTATVYVHKARFSKHIFDKSSYFSICFFDDSYKDVLHYFGTVSGRDEDKMKKCDLTVVEDTSVYFKESSVVVLCKKLGQSDFDVNSVSDNVKAWYQRDGVHTQYYGEIIKVLVND